MREALRRGDVLVLVDIFRFSSTAVTAAAGGVEIVPAYGPADAERQAAAQGVEVAGMGACRYSLSPRSFAGAPAGT